MSAVDKDAREERLPKWAQQQLSMLRMRLSEARGALEKVRGDAHTEGWRVWSDPYGANLPIAEGGRYDTVRFRLGDPTYPDGPYIDVVVRPNEAGHHLEVRSSQSVSVAPVASNVITIGVEDTFFRTSA